MPSYKVLSPGFYDNILRTPGGRHDPVVTGKPLDPVPSWLEPIKSDERKPVRAKRGAKTKVVANPKTAVDGEAELSFKGSGVEEL